MSASDGWQTEQPDNWLDQPDPWEVVRPLEQVQIQLNCSYEVREGTLRAIAGKPSRLIGLPFDRPVVGYGGKTIADRSGVDHASHGLALYRCRWHHTCGSF